MNLHRFEHIEWFMRYVMPPVNVPNGNIHTFCIESDVHRFHCRNGVYGHATVISPTKLEVWKGKINKIVIITGKYRTHTVI